MFDFFTRNFKCSRKLPFRILPREYHTFGNPDTLTRAKDNKVINTKDVDEGEFSKVKTMPPLKPIVTGPKDDQYYVND